MSHCFIGLAGLVGSLLHLPHHRSHQSPILQHAHRWEQGTLGTRRKESQMASCSHSSVSSLIAAAAGMDYSVSVPFQSWLWPASATLKNLIVVDLLVRDNFQEMGDDIKKAFNTPERGGKTSSAGSVFLGGVARKCGENTEKMAFSVTRTHLRGWVTDGLERGGKQTQFMISIINLTSARGRQCVAVFSPFFFFFARKRQLVPWRFEPAAGDFSFTTRQEKP